MKNIYTIVIVCVSAALFSCASFSDKDRREGVNKENLSFRVFVQCDILDLPDLYTPQQLDAKIMADADARYAEIMQLYVSSVDEDKAAELKSLVSKKNKKNEIVYQKVSGDHVDAFVDYSIDAKLADMVLSLERNLIRIVLMLPRFRTTAITC